jgi:hypothetical protein
MGTGHKRIKGVYEGDLAARQWRDIEISGHTGGLIVTPHLFNLEYEGRVFRFNHAVSLKKDEVAYILFRTANYWTHAWMKAAGIFDCTLETYRDAEVADYGNADANNIVFNVNHNIDWTTDCEVFFNPLVINNGKIMSSYRWYIEDYLTAIFKPNTEYLIRMENKHNGENWVNVHTYWDEFKPRVT